MTTQASALNFTEQAQAQQILYAQYAQAQWQSMMPNPSLAGNPYANNPGALNPYMQPYQTPNIYQAPAQPSWQQPVTLPPALTAPPPTTTTPATPDTQRTGTESTPETKPETKKASTLEAENQQLQTYFVETAKKLGLDENIQAGLKYYLGNGFEVSNIDPSKAQNITEFKPQDAENLNRLLKAGLAELQSSQSENEAKTKLGILGSTGELADYDAKSQSYVTYSADKQSSADPKDPQKAKEKGNLFDRYTVKQNVIRFDAQGRPQVQQRVVQAREVDALSTNFDLVDTSTTSSALSGDAGVLSSLKSTLTSTSFKTASETASKKADFGNLDAQRITEAMTPIQDMISRAYGTEGVKLAILPQSPDGGTTMALYNPDQKTVNIFLPAIRKRLIEGTKAGYTGEKLNQYVMAHLTTSVVHENAHGRQYEAIKDPRKFGVVSDSDKKTIESFKLNKQIYNVPQINILLKGDLNDYQNQPVEKGVEAFEDLAKDVLLTQNGFATENVTNS
jgi:hypothetical protein